VAADVGNAAVAVLAASCAFTGMEMADRARAASRLGTQALARIGMRFGRRCRARCMKFSVVHSFCFGCFGVAQFTAKTFPCLRTGRRGQKFPGDAFYLQIPQMVSSDKPAWPGSRHQLSRMATTPCPPAAQMEMSPRYVRVSPGARASIASILARVPTIRPPVAANG